MEGQTLLRFKMYYLTRDTACLFHSRIRSAILLTSWFAVEISRCLANIHLSTNKMSGKKTDGRSGGVMGWISSACSFAVDRNDFRRFVVLDVRYVAYKRREHCRWVQLIYSKSYLNVVLNFCQHVTISFVLLL